MIRILGISAFYHDSAASLIVDGEIIASAQEERFDRLKHSPKFPINAIKYCLEEGGLNINDIDAIVFYDKPFLKFERLLQTYYAFAPKGLLSFLMAMPIWLNEKLFLKYKIYNGLRKTGAYGRKKINLLFSGHHISHAASAFYPSPFRDAAILTIDGVGEWATTSISKGTGRNIEVLKEMEFPHSVGLLYSAFTYFLGFKVNSGEYKVMGLAPFGNVEKAGGYISKITTEIVDIKNDGSIWLNQDYFNYATGLQMIKPKKWEKLFGLSKRIPDTVINQQHCDIALAIQTVLENIVIKMAKEAKRLTNADFLCLAGGVALNCVANTKLFELKLFKDIYVQPAAGDAGGALGSALAVYHMYYNKYRHISADAMKGAYLGPSFRETDIIALNKKEKAVYTKFDDFTMLSTFIASKINQGKVIGWFQGRMEFGPRALGNRSILADARNPKMQNLVNEQIKFRESFRPFAPVILIEDVSEYFEFDRHSPYMVFTPKLKSYLRKPLPDDFNNSSLKTKLNYEKSDLAATTHVDFSSRIQTISKEQNPKLWSLINDFKSLSDCPVLLNTSFNVRGEPIVCTPEDAYRCFINSGLDFLVIELYIYDKTEQH